MLRFEVSDDFLLLWFLERDGFEPQLDVDRV